MGVSSNVGNVIPAEVIPNKQLVDGCLYVKDDVSHDLALRCLC